MATRLAPAISPDTGYLNNDQDTYAQNLYLYGTAPANSTVTLYLAGTGALGRL